MNVKSLEQSKSDNNLDSFLDIITNVIGVLILIACAIVLEVQNFNPPKKTPLLVPSPQGMSTVYFDCSKSRCEEVEYPQEIYDRILAQSREMLGEENWTRNNVAKYCAERQNEWHPEFSVNLSYHAHDVVQATLTMKDANANFEQKFVKRLGELNPADTVIYFYVHGDSFRTFKRARSIAIEHGFQIGWKPIDKLWYVMSDPYNVHPSSHNLIESR